MKIIKIWPFLVDRTLAAGVDLQLVSLEGGHAVPPFPLRFSRMAAQAHTIFSEDSSGLTLAAERLLAWRPAAPAGAGEAAAGATRCRVDGLLEPAPQARPGVPLTAYLAHVAAKRDPGADIETADELLELLHDHLREWVAARHGGAPPLGAAVVEFLNAPQVLAGRGGRAVSRLMLRHWADVRAEFDLFSEEGYFRFLAHWVDDVVEAAGYPVELLPTYIVAALNEPHPDFGSLSGPLSRLAVERCRRTCPGYALDRATARLAWLARFSFEQLASRSGGALVAPYMRSVLATPVVEDPRLELGTLLLGWAERLTKALDDEGRMLLFPGWAEELAKRPAWMPAEGARAGEAAPAKRRGGIDLQQDPPRYTRTYQLAPDDVIAAIALFSLPPSIDEIRLLVRDYTRADKAFTAAIDLTREEEKPNALRNRGQGEYAW